MRLRTTGPVCVRGAAAALLGLALALLPRAGDALSSQDLGFQVIVDLRPGAVGPPPVTRIHAGRASGGLIENLPDSNLRVRHFDELDGTLFLVAQGAGTMIGAFRTRLDDGPPALFVDAAAPFGGTTFVPEISSAMGAAELLTVSHDPRQILFTRYAENSRLLGSEGFEAGLVDDVLDLGMIDTEADTSGFGYLTVEELSLDR